MKTTVTSLFDFIYPPTFKNPLKKRKKEKKIIPKEDNFISNVFNIRVEKHGKTLLWIDEEGEYEVSFSSDVEAYENYHYWCRSANRGGKI